MERGDYDTETIAFRAFYDENNHILESAKAAFMALTQAMVEHDGGMSISKIEGRVKAREECVDKFNRKYRTELEKSGAPYSIREHITDLIGLRVVCHYEDDIEKVRDQLARNFKVIDVNDKIASIENTEGSFGYKGLHLDLKLDAQRALLPVHQPYADFQFEVQIRTIIQDSWSVLDHKIKYKKSIPNHLKRRINTLAALFELADREFREIRDATEAELQRVAVEVAADIERDATSLQARDGQAAGADDATESDAAGSRKHVALDAFAFLRIVGHYFRNQEFDPYKVDGFTEKTVSLDPGLTRRKFNAHLKTTISRVKRYQAHYEAQPGEGKLGPFTLIRHCLYLADQEKFQSLLSIVARRNFESWLALNPGAELPS